MAGAVPGEMKMKNKAQPAKWKRTIPQCVFESKAAIAAISRGHRRATLELSSTPRHLLDEGNPNHPIYDLHIFGEHADIFMSRQYKSMAVK